MIDTVARVDSGSPVERLVCHPRLPLVAGFDATRPAVHVWDFGDGRLRPAGTVGAESAPYGDTTGRDRVERTPAAAWHPERPLLLVAGEGGVVRWTPSGLSDLDGVPTGYRFLAFSPGGDALWASPSAPGGDGSWQHSDVVDPVSGHLGVGPAWDTGVAVHPAGAVVATLSSDQGATHGLFARVDAGTGAMRVLRRALILDVDGYQTPVFSADGRHLAIRGNAYENTLQVFGFPSLDAVLSTTLGEPSPGYPYPQEWLDRMRAWSRHNIAFGTRPGVLWVGTPAGTLVGIDLDGRSAAEHEIPGRAPVTALAATATGELVVAHGTEVVLLSVAAGPAGTANADAARAAATAFLDSTSDVPDEGALWSHLTVTDGDRTWDPDDLDGVGTATDADPTWLRLRAAVNTLFEQNR